MARAGERVGVVKKADAENVHLYGFGVYVGNEIPPKEKRLG